MLVQLNNKILSSLLIKTENFQVGGGYNVDKHLKYFPFQPEIQKNTINYIELKPLNCWYNKEIALFYQFDTHHRTPSHVSLIPDGCFDFLFCCHPSKPCVFLWTSPLFRHEQPEFIKGCTYFGVRFFPEQNLFQLDYAMHELLGKRIPLFDVMKGDLSIIDAITNGHSFSERITLFECYIRKVLQTSPNDQLFVHHAVKEIYKMHGMLNIKELSAHLGYSEQYIRRKFEEIIGFSPKQFSQIIRFQNILKQLTISEKIDMIDVVYEAGFYDQAHFIKTFKKLTNLTPKQYQQKFF